MAGTLTLATLSDGTNSTSSTNCIIGSAKAWVSFNGVSGTTIRASYNISSVTRTGTGLYTINMTNALADDNYAWSGSLCNNGNNYLIYQQNSAPTSSSFAIATGNTGAGADSNYISISVFR